MRDIITESELKQHIEKSYTSFLRSCNNYKRGLESPDEVYKDFCTVLYEGFYDYLPRIGLETRFNDSTWERFTEDYDLWKRGSRLCTETGSAWLLNNDFVEASIHEKTVYFKLMEAYRVPLASLKPIPDHVFKPKCHFHSGSLIITFDLIDDGGLYLDDNPIGKEYILIDDYNLKASLQIERAGKYDEIHNIMDPQYVASGTIEGYTSLRSRKIYISEKRDNKVWFYTNMEKDDYDIHRVFPLWKEYNEFEEERRKKREEHIKSLVTHFMES